jgi:hypothetical protein
MELLHAMIKDMIKMLPNGSDRKEYTNNFAPYIYIQRLAVLEANKCVGLPSSSESRSLIEGDAMYGSKGVSGSLLIYVNWPGSQWHMECFFKNLGLP